MPPDSLRILLAGLVDYAGLFPPAALSMAEVAANYAAYRHSPDAWALGRLVVPVARLRELSDVAPPSENGEHGTWRISALVGDDASHDAERIAAWNASSHGTLIVDTVEVRATSAEAIAGLADTLRDFTVYVEFPLAEDSSSYLDAVARAGARAKMRTGGVTEDAFPLAAQIVRFLRGCAERKLAFKATAGLHHPLRDCYRLTYAPNAPQGEMFGFLNVFLTAAFALEGLPERQLLELVQERNASSLRFTDDAIRWHDEEIDIQRLADIRTSFAIAFGSCSFREPIDDLHQLGLL
ncbi:MAG: hypothetical protein JWL61_82 [Gemmatimonadetes bacterium]|nr:hypothetical protein [Gemmatimonadota bacterium]